jgi:hypothetical protein
MILKGAQRGGARQLAGHLLKDENDHVETIELRGFMADDLPGAFDEAHAVAKGTKCRQFLFSLSLNPPEGTVQKPEDFERAANAIEARLGLKGQPRAIVIHEKEGRRHAHAVWSRIDAETMTARPLPFFKNRLREASRELYLENGWKLPEGLRDPLLRNPENFTREEWQQAKRTERDPREIKQAFQEAWAQSDGAKAFGAALGERGFVLARGDRRGYVALDHDSEVYALSRWTGVKTRALKDRLGDPSALPSVEDAKEQIRKAVTPRLETYRNDLRSAHTEERRDFKARKDAMVAQHREGRAQQKAFQQDRERAEARERALRLRVGFVGLWDTLTGKARAIRDRNRMEAWDCLKRDRSERDALILDQMRDRRALQHEVKGLRDRHRAERRELDRQIGQSLGLQGRRQESAEYVRNMLNRGRDRNRGLER